MFRRIRGIACGGIGAMQLLVQRLGIAEAVDQKLHLLKIHLPYQESDHGLSIAYNALLEGTCLEDIELRCNDPNFLDALGAHRIPDPTTAGDFCRRFQPEHVHPCPSGTRYLSKSRRHFDGFRRGGFFAPSDLMMRLPFPLAGNGTRA